MVELFTIGVYGFTAPGFFDALKSAKIDTFCDIRRRRGVRGAEYAFANSSRLQTELDNLGIGYIHFLDLAPSNEFRKRQSASDKAAKTAKRKRTELSPEFIAGFREECLSAFDSNTFVERLGPGVKRPVLFCVERDPAACHRSLVADKLAQDLGATVTHLMP